MCAHLCVSVRVSLLESFESEDSCWLPHLPVFARVPSLNRKWQEANQKVQEFQASQEVRADQEQRIKVSGPCLVGFRVLAQPPVTRGACSLLSGEVSCLCLLQLFTLLVISLCPRPHARCWGAAESKRVALQVPRLL